VEGLHTSSVLEGILTHELKDSHGSGARGAAAAAAITSAAAVTSAARPLRIDPFATQLLADLTEDVSAHLVTPTPVQPLMLPRLKAAQAQAVVLGEPHLMSKAIRGHQRSSEVLRGHQRSSEVIRGHQRSSEVGLGEPHIDQLGTRAKRRHKGLPWIVGVADEVHKAHAVRVLRVLRDCHVVLVYGIK